MKKTVTNRTMKYASTLLSSRFTRPRFWTAEEAKQFNERVKKFCWSRGWKVNAFQAMCVDLMMTAIEQEEQDNEAKRN